MKRGKYPREGLQIDVTGPHGKDGDVFLGIGHDGSTGFNHLSVTLEDAEVLLNLLPAAIAQAKRQQELLGRAWAEATA